MGVSPGQIDEILELLARFDIATRQERLGGSGGGLCAMQGQQVLFIDLDADQATRLDRAIEALASLPAADDLYVSPSLREELEQRKNR